jgi:hypothetical protein
VTDGHVFGARRGHHPQRQRVAGRHAGDGHLQHAELDARLARWRAAFPGRPHLAYFEFSANEATDTGAVIEEITKLASAGYRISSAEASEKTGYTLTDTGAMPAAPAAPILSRAASASEASPTPAAIEDAAVSALVEARARNLAPVIDRLLAALAETDPAAMHASLSDILDDLPSLAAAAASGADADASLLERILSDAVGAGFASGQARLAKPTETALPAVPPSTRHPRASKP